MFTLAAGCAALFYEQQNTRLIQFATRRQRVSSAIQLNANTNKCKIEYSNFAIAE